MRFAYKLYSLLFMFTSSLVPLEVIAEGATLISEPWPLPVRYVIAPTL
jgi:hypothetical protein